MGANVCEIVDGAKENCCAVTDCASVDRGVDVNVFGDANDAAEENCCAATDCANADCGVGANVCCEAADDA